MARARLGMVRGKLSQGVDKKLYGKNNVDFLDINFFDVLMED